MPTPNSVRLEPHDPQWATDALAWAGRFRAACPGVFIAVHHIGSTAIPAMPAKPIIDLLPVAASLPHLDAARATIEVLDFSWWGENGLPGRRYCTRSDPATGERSFTATPKVIRRSAGTWRSAT